MKSFFMKYRCIEVWMYGSDKGLSCHCEQSETVYKISPQNNKINNC